MNSINRISIFKPRIEQALLWYPIICMFFVPIEFLTGFYLVGDSYRVGRFLADAVLLGTIHSVLSYIMMIFLPECRAWMRASFGNGSYLRAWLRIGFVAAIIFAMFYTVLRTQAPAWIKGIYVFTIYVFGVRHWVRQTQGFTSLYNYHIQQLPSAGPQEKAQIQRIQAREKNLFTVVTYATIAVNLCTYDNELGAAALLGPEVRPWFFIIAMGAAILLLRSAFKTPMAEMSNKVLYAIRILIIPFHSLSLVANFAMRSTHGMEFLATYLKMTENSKFPKSKLRWYFLASVAFVVFAGFCTAMKRPILGGILREDPSVNQFLLSLIMSLDLTFTYFHYYADAIMFRFQDPNVREFIGPLLNEQKVAASPAESSPSYMPSASAS